jgi:hypothetical protein
VAANIGALSERIDTAFNGSRFCTRTAAGPEAIAAFRVETAGSLASLELPLDYEPPVSLLLSFVSS